MRLLADIILLFAVFHLPWWLILLCAAFLFFVFPHFYELFLVAVLLDLLYGAPLERFGNFPFMLSLGALGIFLALSAVKKRMRV